jgi:ubiquinone/menaquinone biosynthesis C-methylase UbiE
MSDMTPDQKPDGWSALAAGYDSIFTTFTRPFANELLDLIGVGPDDDLLDVAAGSGVVSVEAANRGAKSVLGTDFAAGMVSLLEENLAATGHPSTSTAVMDGQNLDVDDGSFDRVTSLFGLIFFPDLDRGFSEMHRALRPGGKVAVSAWNAAKFPWIGFIGQSLAQTIDGFAPPHGPPPMFRISDSETLATYLREAGFHDVKVHEITHQWQMDDPKQFFAAIPTWAPPMAPLFEALDDDVIAQASNVFASLVDGIRGPDGTAASGALIGTGTR